MSRDLPNLRACVAVCRELLADEPELLADFESVFVGERPRWERLADDLRRGLADIAWDALVARGLAPAPDDRVFIDRTARRCTSCTPEWPSWEPCSACAGTREEFVEKRGDRPASLPAALVLAGDLAAMLAAESLARDAAARLWPWRGRHGALPRPTAPPRRVAWRVDVGKGPIELMRGTRALCPLLYDVLARVAGDRRRSDSYALYCAAREPLTYLRSARWPPEPELERAAGAFYDVLAAEGEHVPQYGVTSGMPRRPDGERFAPCDREFAALPNPFTVMVALWDLDAVIERLEADTIVLARRS